MRLDTKVYVWDGPTRLFHWLLVALFAFSWWSAKTDHMDWHRYSGLTVCGLVIFRLLWGVFGTSTSRFGQFVRGPRAVWRYLRPCEMDSQAAMIGHNPLGGWSVVAMLASLVVQIASGLFAVDVDGIESGPLSRFVSFDLGRLAARIHGVSFNTLLVLAGLHLLAIIFYRVAKRRNLVWPMMTGYAAASHAGAGDAVRASSWRLVLVVVAAGLAAFWLASGLKV